LRVTGDDQHAEDFDKRSGALMTDDRRALGDISRAVNNLDRYPTRLLFGAGGSSTPAVASASVPTPPAEAIVGRTSERVARTRAR
jgi:phospholipid/cholesterol/gamma-HCH transport system substrate-binding protein